MWTSGGTAPRRNAVQPRAATTQRYTPVDTLAAEPRRARTPLWLISRSIYANDTHDTPLVFFHPIRPSFVYVLSHLRSL
jgi:hypothetical protein